jgi:hypothetical protein
MTVNKTEPPITYKLSINSNKNVKKDISNSLNMTANISPHYAIKHNLI